MAFKTGLAIAAACAALLAATTAHGAACTGPSPFSDVPQADPYCTNAEWLANRGITLGCGGTSYCPNDFVTRAQMALFLNRFADKVVEPPQLIEISPNALALTGNAVDNLLCQGDVLPAVAYPRRVSMSADFSAMAVGGVANVAIQPMYSINGGSSWVFPNLYAGRVGFDAATNGHVTSAAAFTLPAGSPMRAAMGVFTVSGVTDVASGSRCHVVVQVQSITGASSPFDGTRPPGIVPEGM